MAHSAKDEREEEGRGGGGRCHEVVHEQGVGEDEDESQDDEEASRPVPLGECHIAQECSEALTDEIEPLEVGKGEEVHVHDGRAKGVLEDSLGGEQDVENEEYGQEHGEMAQGESLFVDERMAQMEHSPKAIGKRKEGDTKGDAYARRGEPIQLVAIAEDVDEREDEEAPEDESQPVDAIERARLDRAQCLHEDESQDDDGEQVGDGRRVHGSPPEGIDDANLNPVEDIDAPQDDEEHHGEEYPIVERRSDDTEEVGEALEGAIEAAEATYVAHQESGWHGREMREDEVAHDEDRSRSDEIPLVRKAELEPEGQREIEAEADEYGLSHHRHIAATERKAALHLFEGSEVHAIGELEAYEEDGIEHDAHPLRNPVAEIRQRSPAATTIPSHQS